MRRSGDVVISRPWSCTGARDCDMCGGGCGDVTAGEAFTGTAVTGPTSAAAVAVAPRRLSVETGGDGGGTGGMCCRLATNVGGLSSNCWTV